MTRYSLLLAALCTLAGCAWLRSTFPWLGSERTTRSRLPCPAGPLPESGQTPSFAAAPVRLDGRFLVAIGAATRDLSLDVNEGFAGGGPESETYAVCLAKPESYDAQVIAEDETRYVILVRAVPSRCGLQGTLFGGAAKYEVRKSDYALVSAEKHDDACPAPPRSQDGGQEQGDGGPTPSAPARDGGEPP